MTTWLIVRHGHTDWNEEGRHQGHTDTSLSITGTLQVAAIAARLRDTALDAIYSSDLSRATETALAIAAGRDLTVQSCPDLRERAFGEWEGLTAAEIEAREPGRYARWRAREPDARPEGAETDEEIAARMARIIDHLKAAHSDDEKILLVGHGGSLSYLVAQLVGMQPSSRRSLVLTNTGLSILRVMEAPAVVELWNSTSHLVNLQG